MGQHFLHDEQVCLNIVAQIPEQEDLQLLEVGPGGGALTKYIVEKKHIQYKAIELDTEKIAYLKKEYPVLENKLIERDILKADIPFEGQFSIIGNFPYNISSQILFKVLDWGDRVNEVIGMFQKEVAQRVASEPGNKVYGILSVLLQAYYDIEYLFDVDEKCFTPPPKVKSGVIKMKRNNNPHNIIDNRKFTILVKAAFGQRRKTLRNALKSLLSPEALQDPVMDKRAEQLSVADFVELQKKYYS